MAMSFLCAARGDSVATKGGVRGKAIASGPPYMVYDSLMLCFGRDD